MGGWSWNVDWACSGTVEWLWWGGSMSSTDQRNERAWDDLVRRGSSFANPALPEDFQDPQRVINPFGWMPLPLQGRRVLCLAAGGGRHGPVFAAEGADVAVVDISAEMLTLDQEVAARRGLTLQTVKTTMVDLSAFGDGVFDVVLQPVSTCYVPEVALVYREVARVLRPGGTYISQHKQPVSMQASVLPASGGRYLLEEPYYRSGPLPPVSGSEHREVGTEEYLHTLEELLGGLCAAGFLVADVREPRHADPKAPQTSFRARSCYVPPYVAIHAIRKEAQPGQAPAQRLWTPGS